MSDRIILDGETDRIVVDGDLENYLKVVPVFDHEEGEIKTSNSSRQIILPINFINEHKTPPLYVLIYDATEDIGDIADTSYIKSFQLSAYSLAIPYEMTTQTAPNTWKGQVLACLSSTNGEYYNLRNIEIQGEKGSSESLDFYVTNKRISARVYVGSEYIKWRGPNWTYKWLAIWPKI